MRCDNCGWMNPEGAENCQKCNQKLRPSHFEEHKVVNVPKQEPAPVPAVVNCDKCGREYSLQMPSCPHCGFSNPKFQEDSAPAPKANDMNKTVAFGVGMAPSQQSVQSKPAFEVQDKSELKKTMVAGRETPASPVVMPPFGVQDKSELKKTMVAAREEAPEAPVAMPPFGVQDKSELKKTMVAAREEAPEAPVAMPPFGVQDKSELKKTMVAAREEAPEAPVAMPQFGVQDKSELKKTMVAGDFDSFQMSVAKAADASKNIKNTVCDMSPDCCENYKYCLQSMDHGMQDVISLTISASSDICLKSGEVILIAGMRYRVI